MRFVPARDSVPRERGSYEVLERSREMFGVKEYESTRTILSYGSSERQLYRARELHLRRQVANEVIYEIVRDVVAEVDIGRCPWKTGRCP